MSHDHRTRRQIPAPQPAPHSHRRKGSGILDGITTLFVIATVLVIGSTVLLVSNPEAGFNPFPKPTLPKLLTIPTATITPTPTISPTPLPTLSPTPLPSFTPTSTFTITPTFTHTPTQVLAGATGAGTAISNATISTGIALTPQPAVPTDYPFDYAARPVRSEANQNIRGCQWLGIAGNVSGVNGEPLTDMAIEVIGDDFEQIVFSGSNQNFGFAGYEVQVDDQPVRDQYTVRLLGPTGLPVSDFVTVVTGETCNTNLAIVEFVQIR